MTKVCDHHRLSTIGSDGHIPEVDPGLLMLPGRKRRNTRKTNECRQEESGLKALKRGSFALDSGVPVIDWSVLVDAHDVCPLVARKGWQGKISPRLFREELAGRIDLEQGGLR
jgi:hypothetical protein